MKIQKTLKKQALSLTLNGVNKLNLPKAMLIIPDGNGRWAKKMGLDIASGHREGGKTISEVLTHFLSINIEVLGIWGFSEDNWKRPKDETDKIMEVIENTIYSNLNKLLQNNIKFLVLGKRDRIKNEYQNLENTILNATEKTSLNTGKILALFIDYGERYQLEEFAKARKTDNLTPTYELLSKINGDLPLFDMVLRTSGEQRLSGFGPLVSLAEFVSVEKNLPELTDLDIIESLRKYSNRKRRFGARP